ncbi:ABC transporter ATP-binding protein [Rhodopila sp.]|jgi:branched-chain amino acid transport system ATP-binding protein|uniref:ABC transporter ATP-binding protein n=1 Tax=Rhodopila sp. TaxID=2480087 RepID=UPI002CFD6AD7|nr:ABC transporter ATP-binding protein [Rhodopila sp.]HVZ07005.1 ABC transporter ATP-binding protein [Rhodopila sp.]
MLEYRKLEARYGGFTALRDITISVRPGERVAVFGHNGAGKTTLLRCGLGDVDDVSGTVTYNGDPIIPGSVYRNARKGIGFVPQGHNVFRDLSVAQNLRMAGLLHDQAYIDEVYRLFPVLLERRAQIAGSLSGGQQQMLAVGMALMTRPTILMLDEPTTGLAPVIVQDMFRSLIQINETTGTAIMLVEQNVAAALRIVQRAIVLKTGGVIFDGPSAELARHEDMWRWF